MSSFTPGAPPSVDALFAQWVGGFPADVFFTFDSGTAGNLVFGGNPPFQISDFLSIYPKFGSFAQGLQTVALNAAGLGYAANDVLALVQADASGGQITVNTVDGSGRILTFTVTVPGTGYSLASGLAVTGGTGAGALFNVLQVTPYSGVLPQAALQMYINLAAASLQQARWLDSWFMGMCLFVAHYATLYLRSEGNAGTTAGQIATSGLSRGFVVSKSAGDVSQSQQALTALEDWGAWMQTSYGEQLVTTAKIIGMGPMYIYG